MEPIGIIRTPFTELTGMPIQPSGARGTRGDLIIKPEYADGLADLAGFSHLYLIYLFHQTRRTQLKVVPFLDDTERGVFATR
ncbi:MAG: TrmO family methyltransferase, partial [Desulfofustis sp.]